MAIDSQRRPTQAHKSQHSKAAAGGAQDVTRLEPQVCFLFLIDFILTNDILQTILLPNQTRNAHESQCRPTIANESHHKPTAANAGQWQ